VVAAVIVLAVLAAGALVALVLGRASAAAEAASLRSRLERAEAQLEVVDTALQGLARGSQPTALLGTMGGSIARAVGAERVTVSETAPAGRGARRIGGAGWLVAEGGDAAALEQIGRRLETLVRLVETRGALVEARVESEALRRSDELKTALLRALGHELRTPLAAVRASAAALGSLDVTTAEQRPFVQAIEEQSELLRRIFDDLLDYSRLQAGLEARLAWIDLADVVEDVVRGLEAAGRARVRTRFGARVPPLLLDLAFLQRALSILLDNALAYGAGDVLVETRRVRQSIRLSVANAGRGIAADEEERIFEPFYRGRSSSGQSGSGLGLPIARSLVEATGGTLRVERGERLETRLTMTFPVPRTAAA
jgi:two-component system sensor histidine kinase KdpD